MCSRQSGIWKVGAGDTARFGLSALRGVPPVMVEDSAYYA
jgi:hypothetical protein